MILSWIRNRHHPLITAGSKNSCTTLRASITISYVFAERKRQDPWGILPPLEKCHVKLRLKLQS